MSAGEQHFDYAQCPEQGAALRLRSVQGGEESRFDNKKLHNLFFGDP
jgi:hypothetical protein